MFEMILGIIVGILLIKVCQNATWKQLFKEKDGGLLAEKKAIRAESRRLRAMYEAAKGDLDDVLRSRDEVTDLLEEAQG